MKNFLVDFQSGMERCLIKLLLFGGLLSVFVHHFRPDLEQIILLYQAVAK